ncbi:MAG: ABC transporter permease [Bacteroidetes bacterium]|nr:ABC transporter permease [Bacteroidota bacterium]
MFERYQYIFNIALEAVFLNKFRSMLTALGIIFGVAAVIAMMAIGNGAQKEILDQMKLVGVNNIIITPKIEKNKGSSSQNNDQSSSSSSSDKNKGKFSPGLSLKDAESIREMIPTVLRVSPVVIYEADVIREAVRYTTKISGVTPDFFDLFNIDLQQGDMFNAEQLKEGKAVCIIGSTIQSKFFPNGSSIGQEIKCGRLWLKVIGVLRKKEVNQSTMENLGISDYNNSVFAPIQTLMRRVKDRTMVTSASLHGSSGFEDFGDVAFSFNREGEELAKNQVDKIVVQVKQSSQITPTTDLLKRMLLRRHQKLEDFEIKVPELLLKQEQRTKDIFNIVLGCIAGISLLVGGIGIMNIMLASVMERIKEIGIRRAIGATKRDIALQFLMEATLLSITGGLIGIILGIIFSKLIMQFTSILTIISPISIIISFGVSASVGIIFGYMPAKQASAADPVESLRHE